MNRVSLICILAVILILLSAAIDSLQTHSSGQVVAVNRDDAIQKFQNSLVGRGRLKRNRATGLVDFVRLDRTTPGSLAPTNAGTYAHSGDRIKLRWDLSTDYCFGTNSGWYLDNVRVYACRP